MNVIPAEQWLGFRVLDRKALFTLLSRGYRDKNGNQKDLPYRTFYKWANDLDIPTNEPAYFAEDVLLLVIYMWLRNRGNRNLDRDTVSQFIGEYQNVKVRFDPDRFALSEPEADDVQNQPSSESPGAD